ncbi:hypothetical protein [Novosphingobium sp.]|uniref:hypothetical protein n=1 Tax=Novosphingobium sp. TaxID=1874826 RepID=UPI002603BB45|nr:hypothetical protein [Novosphingobium sp.]
MKIAAAQRNLSLYDLADKRVEAIATQLRGAGLLPKGGRGPYAPDANEVEIALFTIAVGAGGKVADAVETAMGLAKTVDADGLQLLKVLAHAVSDTDKAHSIQCVYLFPGRPMARMALRDGLTRHFFAPAHWTAHGFNPDAQGQAFAGPIGFIGGAVLDQMALDFAQNQPAGDDAGELS